MSKENPMVYPYIPNSEPKIKELMLKEIGVKNVEEFYEDIPENLRLQKSLISIFVLRLKNFINTRNFAEGKSFVLRNIFIRFVRTHCCYGD